MNFKPLMDRIIVRSAGPLESKTMSGIALTSKHAHHMGRVIAVGDMGPILPTGVLPPLVQVNDVVVYRQQDAERFTDEASNEFAYLRQSDLLAILSEEQEEEPPAPQSPSGLN